MNSISEEISKWLRTGICISALSVSVPCVATTPTKYLVDATTTVWFVDTCAWDGSACSYPPPPAALNVNSGDKVNLHFEYLGENIYQGANYLLLDNPAHGFLASVTIGAHTWTLDSSKVQTDQASLYLSADTYLNGLTYYQIEWRVHTPASTPDFPFSLGLEDITLNLRTTPPNTLFTLPPHIPASNFDINSAAFDSNGYGGIDTYTSFGPGPYNRLHILFKMPIDSINIQAVPEPQSWALLIAGTALIGYRIKARRASSNA